MLNQSSRQASRRSVGAQNIFQRSYRRRLEPLQYLVNDRCNTYKVQAAFQKRLYRNLIGGVQHRRRGAAGARRGPGKGQAREPGVIRGFESQLPNGDEVQ